MIPEEWANEILRAVCDALGGAYPNTRARSIIATAIREAVEAESRRCADIAIRTFVQPKPTDPELGPVLPGFGAGYREGCFDLSMAIAETIMGVETKGVLVPATSGETS